MPASNEVTALGDGELDGTELQAALRQLHRPDVCRPALPHHDNGGHARHSGYLAPQHGELLTVRPAWTTAEA